METSNKIAQSLLKIDAIKLDMAKPFTWASGWKSPIYCDNRRSLAFPEIRAEIRDEFVALIKALYPDVEMIAGVATGAIAHGMLVADKLGLPFVYVRGKAKDHGLKRTIEGGSPEGRKVVIVEDLISTGGSSLEALENLRAEKADVLGMVAIFTYEFDKAAENFKAAHCTLSTLSNFTTLAEQALADGYIQQADVAALKRWHTAPDKFFGT